MSMALLTAVLAVATVLATPGMASPLASEQWHKRVVLIFSLPDDARAGRQRDLLLRDRQALDDRDMLVLEIRDGTVVPLSGQPASRPDADALRQRFGITEKAFAVVLIGKDGGEKLRRTKPIAAADLFGVIDAMPMRQSEMARTKVD